MAAEILQLDTRIQIVTPENIAFKYRVAGPFRRGPALLIDWLVLFGIMFATLFVVAAMYRIAFLSALSARNYLWFGLLWFYGGLLETFWNGQTIGKKAMGIRVVTVDGQPISGLQAVARNVLRVVDALPAVPLLALLSEDGARLVMAIFPDTQTIALFQFGLLAPACNPRFQRLGDLACGTMVVVDENQQTYGVLRVNEQAAIRLADEIPVNFTPSRTLVRALSVYVARRARFSPGRRAVIAEPLGKLLRIQFKLPVDTNLDTLLCAVYHRALIADGTKQSRDQAWEPPPTPTQSRAATIDSFLDQMA